MSAHSMLTGESLAEIFLARGEAGARPAIIFKTPQGETVLSWAELHAGAQRYAARYAAANLAGEVIVTLLPTSPDLVFSFWGAMLMGAIPAILPFPTPKLDPALYKASLQALVRVTQPAAFVAEASLAAEMDGEPRLGGWFEGAAHPMQFFTPEGGRSTESMEAFFPLSTLHSPLSPLCLLQHSSGTTGLQKGVALSHQAVLNQLRAYLPALQVNEADVVVSWLPLYHDMGLVAGFLLPLLAGIPLVLMSPFDWVRAPWMLLQAVSEHSGTLTWLPNFAYNFCAQKIQDRHLEGLRLDSWRAVINCSEPMYAASHRLFAERFAPYGFSPAALKTCYAMAENVFAVTQGGFDAPVRVDRIQAKALVEQQRAIPSGEQQLGAAPGEEPPAEGATIEMLSAGPPLPNCQVRVVGQDGDFLPERQVGELVIQSDCLLSGYHQRPDLNAQAFLSTPETDWYRTGDLGYLADGEVYITGRKKDIMIIGGKNLYPQDIEQLLNSVPGVHPGRVVVFSVPNPQAGTEEMVAIVERDSEEAESLTGTFLLALRQAVASGTDAALGQVRLVEPGWIIKTSSGKPARAANREKYLKLYSA